MFNLTQLVFQGLVDFEGNWNADVIADLEEDELLRLILDRFVLGAWDRIHVNNVIHQIVVKTAFFV